MMKCPISNSLNKGELAKALEDYVNKAISNDIAKLLTLNPNKTKTISRDGRLQWQIVLADHSGNYLGSC
jgi:hypothetical protein